MFFAIAKFIFEDAGDGRDLGALVKKIQARFPVCVRSLEADGVPLGFVVASLGTREHQLSQQLDEIAAFAEGSGFGRIRSEDVVLDHTDNLAE